MHKTILCVSSKPNLPKDMIARSANRGRDWSITHVKSGVEALVWLRDHPCDAVLCDHDAGNVSGAKFLNEIQSRHPRTLRFLFAGLEKSREAVSNVGATHHLLPSPCPAHAVECALDRAFDLSVWLPSDITTNLMSSMRNIPSPPTTYFQIVKELQSPHSSMESVGDIIAKDPAVSAKLLQLANSSMLGLQLQVSSVPEALMYLGMETTKSLVLLAHTFSHFDGAASPGISIDALWRHSFDVGRHAQKIAEYERSSDDEAGLAFTAGLLHDFGKLLIAANQPAKLRESLQYAKAHGVPLWDAERQVLGTDHAEVGGCLLGIWGLPRSILEAVALHHQPVQFAEQDCKTVAIVHVADVLAGSLAPAVPDVPPSALDTQFLTAVGFGEKVQEWNEACREEAVDRAA